MGPASSKYQLTVNVLLIEPYYGGSHRTWVDGYRRFSSHHVDLMALPAQFWKWRMQGGAVTLARMFRDGNFAPDVILASDMMDVSTFRALTRDLTANIPVALYFHESQFTYPQNSRQFHGWRYAFTNYVSALSADVVYFNSQYHHDVFFENLPRMLKHFGDYNELQTVDEIRAKASVLALGLDLRRYDAHRLASMRVSPHGPLILWNHRWEEEKNPAVFVAALYALQKREIPFRVALVGENVRKSPEEFEAARERLGERVVKFGFVADFAAYARLLWETDYVVSTAYQDFFGGAVAEAIYCGCVPLLARRLNYTYLLPEPMQAACTFKGDDLLPQLERHLNGEYMVDHDALSTHIARFDWSAMAPQYDAALVGLIK